MRNYNFLNLYGILFTEILFSENFKIWDLL